MKGRFHAADSSRSVPVPWMSDRHLELIQTYPTPLATPDSILAPRNDDLET